MPAERAAAATPSRLLDSRFGNAYSSPWSGNQTRDLTGAIEAATGMPFTELRVDGGACRNDFLMQFQADLLGVPVERPDVVETTALGAAALAGLALGVWPSLEAFVATRRHTAFAPRSSVEERERLMRGWRRAVETALFWARAGRGDDGTTERRKVDG